MTWSQIRKAIPTAKITLWFWPRIDSRARRPSLQKRMFDLLPKRSSPWMHRYKRWSSGRWAFSQLLSEGLKPDDVLVDYGCGTLRMGLHAIRYLAPGNYWGLDINEKVLEYASTLASPLAKLHLRIISPASVEEALLAKPALLCSFDVIQQCDPSGLDEYFSNILKIIGTSGTGIIKAKWSETNTFRFGQGRHFAHSINRIGELVSLKGGRLNIVRETDWCSLEGEMGKAGLLRIGSL